ncbi:MAG TPA: hypothetical protein VJM47_06395 [Nitrosospira sp.]|nr:hypothetical protein [Nitrosospira sp.]
MTSDAAGIIFRVAALRRFCSLTCRALSLPHRIFPVRLLPVFILFFAASASMAAERTLGPDGPPLAYPLQEVNLHLTRQPGNAAFPVWRVSLLGKGTAIFERGDELLQVAYPIAELIDLLNELYRIRFFDLPSQYTRRYSIFLKGDGTVATSALRMMDAASTRICFAVTGYEKCVTFGRDGPHDLENIVNRVFDDVEKRVEKQLREK